ncbi:collagen alpha-1(I) chain-like [Ahaetulla prasina]|uniref:collagen alpha-1(I) chain-like n=1 Tax=Ahaetulla prasina TaxID=499056 RepID=UPI002647C64C|nr:collagen alpha-1(I) chain-like [Ahaetulla prasina]
MAKTGATPGQPSLEGLGGGPGGAHRRMAQRCACLPVTFPGREGEGRPSWRFPTFGAEAWGGFPSFCPIHGASFTGPTPISCPSANRRRDGPPTPGMAAEAGGEAPGAMARPRRSRGRQPRGQETPRLETGCSAPGMGGAPGLRSRGRQLRDLPQWARRARARSKFPGFPPRGRPAGVGRGALPAGRRADAASPRLRKLRSARPSRTAAPSLPPKGPNAADPGGANGGELPRAGRSGPPRCAEGTPARPPARLLLRKCRRRAPRLTCPAAGVPRGVPCRHRPPFGCPRRLAGRRAREHQTAAAAAAVSARRRSRPPRQP